MTKKLTVKQQCFVEELPKDWNATQACIRAKFSKKTARHMASKLLTLPHIQAALADTKEKIIKKCAISTERLVKEWNCIAFLNPDDLFQIDFRGVHTFKQWQDIPEHSKRAISEIQQVLLKDGSMGFKVRFHSKPVALRNLGELNGNYVERKEIGEPGAFEKYTDEQLEDAITRRTVRIGGNGERTGTKEGQQEPDSVRRLH